MQEMLSFYFVCYLLKKMMSKKYSGKISKHMDGVEKLNTKHT